MKNTTLSDEKRNCLSCHKINGLHYYQEWGENDAYYRDQCFEIHLFTGIDLSLLRNRGVPDCIAYPHKEDKLVPRDDRELLKKCLSLLSELDRETENLAEQAESGETLARFRCSSNLMAEIGDFYKEVEIYQDLKDCL